MSVGTDATPDASASTRDELAERYLAELAEVAAELAEVPKLYERRVTLFELMRDLDPPVPFDTISKTDGASAEACRVALLKKRRADEGRPITRKKSGT